MRKNISQREARALRKRVSELENLLDRQRRKWGSEYVGGVSIPEMPVVPYMDWGSRRQDVLTVLATEYKALRSITLEYRRLLEQKAAPAQDGGSNPPLSSPAKGECRTPAQVAAHDKDCQALVSSLFSCNCNRATAYRVCGAVSPRGLLCRFPPEHDGNHSWADSADSDDKGAAEDAACQRCGVRGYLEGDGHMCCTINDERADKYLYVAHPSNAEPAAPSDVAGLVKKLQDRFRHQWTPATITLVCDEAVAELERLAREKVAETVRADNAIAKVAKVKSLMLNWRDGMSNHHYNVLRDIDEALSETATADSTICTRSHPHELMNETCTKFADYERKLAEGRAEMSRVRDWLDNNMTGHTVAHDADLDGSNVPALAYACKKFWYHAADDMTSYPFSKVVDKALSETAPEA